MFKQFIEDVKAGFEDGPDLLWIYDDFSLFFLTVFGGMFLAMTGAIIVLCGMLFYSIETLSFSTDIGYFALLSAFTAVLIAVWLFLKYATSKLWLISQKRHQFLRSE